MCHLCERVLALDDSIETKTLKPVLLALSPLHRLVKPNLEQYYQATRLRKTVCGMHKVVPKAALTDIIKEVDDELEYCKKQMAGRHAESHSQRPHDQGSRNSSIYSTRSSELWTKSQDHDSIAPSESASVEITRERDRRETAQETRENTVSRKTKEKKAESSPELSGSDLDPPPGYIKRCYWVVEKWLTQCDAAVANEQEEDISGSILTILGGDVYKRPRLDVPAWTIRKVTRKSGAPSLTPGAQARSSHSHCHNHNTCHQARKRLYALDLDILVADTMPRNTPPRSKAKLMDKIFTALNLKKAEKKHKQRRVTFDDAPAPSRREVKHHSSKAQYNRLGSDEGLHEIATQGHREKRDNSKPQVNDLGGQLSKPTVYTPRHRVTRNSASMRERTGANEEGENKADPPRRRVRRDKSMTETKVPKTKERTSPVPKDARRYGSSQDSSSASNASNAILSLEQVRDCVDKIKQKWWESSTSLSGTTSRRASPINLGSIMEQPATPMSGQTSTPSPMSSKQFKPSPPRPKDPWLSDSQSQCRTSTKAQTTNLTATSLVTSCYMGPLPSSFASIVPQTYETASSPTSDFTRNRERRRAERNVVIPAPLPQAVKRVVTHVDQNLVSDAIRERRVRRAERSSKEPGAERYHKDERERLWSSQKA